MLLGECKISWNRIMNGIDILFMKDFNIVHVKSIVGKWLAYQLYIENKKMKKYLCKQKHIF